MHEDAQREIDRQAGCDEQRRRFRAPPLDPLPVHVQLYPPSRTHEELFAMLEEQARAERAIESNLNRNGTTPSPTTYATWPTK